MEIVAGNPKMDVGNPEMERVVGKPKIDAGKPEMERVVEKSRKWRETLESRKWR